MNHRRERAEPAEEWGPSQAPARGAAFTLGEPGATLPAIERGALIIIRQFDVADEVDLAKVQSLQAAARSTLTTARATTLLLSNPPVAIPLPSRRIQLGAHQTDVDMLARVFNFGAVSIRLRLRLDEGLPWSRLAELVRAATLDEQPTRAAREASDTLIARLATALTGRHESALFEDYAVVFVERFSGEVSPRALPRDAVARLLLGEEDAALLTDTEIAEATRHRSGYYTDDLYVAGWNVALVVEPRGDADPVDVLELANAQLLELRYYDDLLDRELGRLYDDVGTRRRGLLSFFRGYGALLRRTMAILLEIAEFVERVENALKIIGDVYLARLYGSAVDVLRIQAWERSVTRKQALVQQVYDVLKHEVDTLRDQAIEFTILILIVGELFLALHVTR